ncbi:MAG: hypothetical protein U1F77_03485 [Kiritimatiellia bacterium]
MQQSSATSAHRLLLADCDGRYDATPTLTFADATAALLPAELRAPAWTATDKCGNVKNCSQAITVQDTTPHR